MPDKNTLAPVATMLADDALMLGAIPLNDFAEALALGSDWTHPKQRNGKNCFYYWKESLPADRAFIDAKGKQWKFTGPEIDDMVDTMKLARSRGFEPYIPATHRADGKNYGYIVDAKRNEKGNLTLLHQFIGEDSSQEVLTKKTSICILPKATDENGNTYKNLVDHNAAVPNPQLWNLDDFTPALAASSGQATNVIVLELAAPPTTKEVQMDLSKLRTRLGAASDMPDDKVLELAETRIGELDTAKATAVALSAERDNLQSQIVTLSRTEDDAKPGKFELHYLSKTIELAEKEATTAGLAPFVVTAARKKYLGDVDTTTLTLSREPGDNDGHLSRGLTAYNDFLELAKMNKPVRGSEVKPGDVAELSRTTGDDSVSKDRRAELLGKSALGSDMLTGK